MLVGEASYVAMPERTRTKTQYDTRHTRPYQPVLWWAAAASRTARTCPYQRIAFARCDEVADQSLRRENLAKPLNRAQHLLLRQPWPLAAHDEVIDTQKLAIARNFLLHRSHVANDEPVAREILERTLRGAVLQSP